LKQLHCDDLHIILPKSFVFYDLFTQVNVLVSALL